MKPRTSVFCHSSRLSDAPPWTKTTTVSPSVQRYHQSGRSLGETSRSGLQRSARGGGRGEEDRRGERGERPRRPQAKLSANSGR